MNKLYLEPPYDRGFTWLLRLGEEKARLSYDSAMKLECYGIPVYPDGKPRTKLNQKKLAGFKSSKKVESLIKKFIQDS